MKKIEIGTEFPRHFQSLYPEEFSLFSHLETGFLHSLGALCDHYMEGERTPQNLLPRLEQLLRGTGFISRRVGQSLSAHAHLCQYPA